MKKTARNDMTTLTTATRMTPTGDFVCSVGVDGSRVVAPEIAGHV
jgi:hypothetical protein